MPSKQRPRKQTPLRKALENVLGAVPRTEHNMTVLNAMHTRAFGKFAAEHILKAISGKGPNGVDFGRIHTGIGHLLDEKSPLSASDKNRLRDAMVRYYNGHPYQHWVQRATLIHAMAKVGFHHTEKGRGFFQKITENRLEHDLVKGTALKYIQEKKK